VSGVVEARGLVLQALGERPRLHELTVDPLGPGEVRIRMRATEAAAHRGLHLRLGQPFENTCRSSSLPGSASSRHTARAAGRPQPPPD